MDRETRIKWVNDHEAEIKERMKKALNDDYKRFNAQNEEKVAFLKEEIAKMKADENYEKETKEMGLSLKLAKKYLELYTTSIEYENYLISEEFLEGRIKDRRESIIAYEFSNCEEKLGKVDLSSVLKSIRHNDYETAVCLYIKDNKILDRDDERGAVFSCGFPKEKTKKIMEKAKKLGADIYFLHNHPFSLGAQMSGSIEQLKDFDEIKKMKKGDYSELGRLTQISKKYGIKILDFAVVTEYDYLSLNQKGII